MSLVVSSNRLITHNSLLFNCNKFKYELLSLQKRIYKAAISYDYKRMHKLQRLLLSSTSSKLVAMFITIQNYFKSNIEIANNSNLWQAKSKCNISNINIITNYINAKQLLNLLTSQIVVADLDYKINQNIIYFCLKPEWEAKLHTSKFQHIINNCAINKLNLISDICVKYNKIVDTKYIYILQGNINIFQVLQSFAYLKNKLHAITQIDKLVINYLRLCLRKSNKVSNFMLPQLAFLLTNIIMEDLATHVYLKHRTLISIASRNKNIDFLQQFIWHSNNFIFISNSKNEIVFVKSQIQKFYNTISLGKSIRSIQISNLKQGFNFLGFRIKSLNYNSTIIITPSFESKLTLLKNIKNILYHKDKLYRNRANTYLSTKSAITKIYPILQNWKNYYCSNCLVNIVSLKHLNTIIQEIIYRWEIKKYRKKSKLKYQYNILLIY